MRDPRLDTPHEVELPAGTLRYFETEEQPEQAAKVLATLLDG